MVNPSSVLPILKQDTPVQDIQTALQFLDDCDFGSLDELELQHAKTWVTKLMKLPQDDESLDLAATLLQSLSGAKSSDDTSSTYTFHSVLSAVPMNVHIRSTHMNSVDATGFCTWSSGKLLASMLLAEPQSYFAISQEAPIRILELGSGTGLAGIAALKACELLQFEAEVHFTDYDESTLSTLQENVNANLAAAQTHQHSVRKLDWRDYLDAAKVTAEEPFHIILGADIIYEREHGRLVCSVVRNLLLNEGVFHLVIPLRYTHVADITAFEEELQSSGLQAMDIRQLDKEDGQYAHRYYRIRRMQK